MYVCIPHFNLMYFLFQCLWFYAAFLNERNYLFWSHLNIPLPVCKHIDARLSNVCVTRCLIFVNLSWCEGQRTDYLLIKILKLTLRKSLKVETLGIAYSASQIPFLLFVCVRRRECVCVDVTVCLHSDYQLNNKHLPVHSGAVASNIPMVSEANEALHVNTPEGSVSLVRLYPMSQRYSTESPK